MATRASPLALWQARRVAALVGGDCQLVEVETEGDRRREVSLSAIGARGVFVKEVQAAVLDGRADIAVHSAKDLPSSAPTPGLVLAAFPERADPRDALVGATLAGLRPGALVRTGSARRRAQLANLRPDLVFADLRGNLATRLAKAGDAAVVVAAAALARLGEEAKATEILEPSSMLPQVGQGALAVECREGDGSSRALLAGVDDPACRVAVEAERAFLAELGGGCELPVGALATRRPDGGVEIEGLLASLDGRVVLRARALGDEPEQVGASLARSLVVDRGGALLMEDLALPEDPGRAGRVLG